MSEICELTLMGVWDVVNDGKNEGLVMRYPI